MSAADVDAVDFGVEEDELLDDDAAMEEDEPVAPKVKSAVTGGGLKTKGRGFRDAQNERVDRQNGQYESLRSGGAGPGPAKSVEGYIILVTGVHEEAQEDDLQEAFGEFGEIKNLHLNLDRRTGFVKGYALIEYESKAEAAKAIAGLDGAELLTQTIRVSWAFSNAALRSLKQPPRREYEDRGRQRSRLEGRLG
jgi:RNA-binding protein 8A